MNRLLLLILSVFSLFAASTFAQSPDPPGTNTEVPQAKSASTSQSVEGYGKGKRWSFYLTLSGLFDSNINHDEDDINDSGLVGGAGIYFRNRAERPNFEFTYEIGQHAYRSTDRWDRTSHNFKVRSENRLGKQWVSETNGEVSFKGSTEDRELTNQYTLRQFFQYRLTRSNRFNFGGAYRLKRYDDLERDRNSTNPYLEVGYEKLFGDGNRRLEFMYRYEENNARNDRFSYIRWTYGAQYNTPFFKKGRLELEARYRPQKYSRLIELELPSGEDIEVPRRDKRWIFAAEWRRPLWQGLELGLIYKHERRDSNDNDKDFNANLGGVVLTYRWWK